MLIWESFITIVWLFARVHVEAFSAFGQVPHVGGSKIQLGAMTSTRTPPLISKVPCQESTFGQERRGCVPMQLSTADSDVDSPVGKSNTEGHSAVLDSLIEQFTSPENGNITATVEEYLDLCDHALLTRLRGRIESEGDHSTLVRVLPPEFCGLNLDCFPLAFISSPLPSNPRNRCFRTRSRLHSLSVPFVSALPVLVLSHFCSFSP